MSDILLTSPLLLGVSTTVTVWFSLLKPSPLMQSLCLFIRPIPLFTNFIVIVLSLLMMLSQLFFLFLLQRYLETPLRLKH